MALPSSTRQGELAPLGFPSFGGYGGQNFSFRLADTSRRDDRPPTHFFVKKKWVGGAESTTQKVSSGLCAEIPVRRRKCPPPEGSFFLYEKSVLRESDCLRGRRPEVCTDLTPNPFALNKPLK
jgi:hypothetical protein